MNPRPRSLEHRLMFRLIGILSASFILFALFYAFVIDSDAEFHAAEEAGELAGKMARAIRPTPGGGHEFNPAAVASLADWPQGASYAAIDLSSLDAVTGSSPVLLSRLRSRSARSFFSADLSETPTGLNVFVTARATADGTPFGIAVLRPTTRQQIVWSGLQH